MIKTSFNKEWRYCDLDDGQSPFAEAPKMTEITLPHDAMIHRKRKPDIPGGAAGGYYENKNTVYEKNFTLSADADSTYILEFEGVFANSSVFVNDNYAGGRHYGYSSFLIDITDSIAYNGENNIRVSTRTGMGMMGRWYTGDGIYRNVWLYRGGEEYLIPKTSKVTTENIKEGSALISICGRVHAYKNGLTVCAEAINSAGYIAGTWDSDVDSEGNYRISGIIPHAELWSTDSPELYKMNLTLKRDETVIDTETLTFGIRTIEVRPGEGLLINGDPVKLRGGCIHHENGILGAAESTDAAKRRIRILKEAGYNAIRSAHNPASESLLAACDELGMYVMDEAFDMWILSKTEYDYSLWFKECWKEDVDSLICKDHNHPSVILYCIGNEIQNLNTEYGVETNRKLADYVRSLDSTRPVLNSVNGMFVAMAHMGEILQDVADGEEQNGLFEINQVMTMLDTHMDEIMRHRYITEMLEPISENLDIVGYNYMGGRYESDTVNYPNRVIVGSETRPDTIWENWKSVEKLPNVIGDFVWTAWDYIGEAGIGRVDFENPDSPMYAAYPWYIAYTGDIDICGNRRPASYYREIVWGLRDQPYIAVHRPQNIGKKAHTSNWSWSDSVHSWTWPGYEGSSIIADVYSNADEVELFLNGRSIGRAAVGEEIPGMARFDLKYEPGTLSAAAYHGRELTGIDHIDSAGTEKELSVILSSDSLQDGNVLFADIAITDTEGTVDMSVVRRVSIKTEGPIQLEGFGSADPKSEEEFSDKIRSAYDGRLLAAFRKGEGAGTAKVVFECEGLAPAEKTIIVQ